MNYTTHTEDFVKDLYLKIGIYQPHQLNYKTIAEALGIKVFPAPYDGPSQALFLIMSHLFFELGSHTSSGVARFLSRT